MRKDKSNLGMPESNFWIEELMKSQKYDADDVYLNHHMLLRIHQREK